MHTEHHITELTGIEIYFFFSSRRRHTRCSRDWSSDVCSSDLSPAQAMRLGMAFLTEDRKDTGCFMGLDLLANMEVALLHERHVRWGLVAHAAVARECEDMARTLQVRSPGLHEIGRAHV